MVATRNGSHGEDCYCASCVATRVEQLDTLCDRIFSQQNSVPEAVRVDFWNRLTRDPALHKYYFGKGPGEDRNEEGPNGAAK
jgi:hypothetical protein